LRPEIGLLIHSKEIISRHRVDKRSLLQCGMWRILWHEGSRSKVSSAAPLVSPHRAGITARYFSVIDSCRARSALS